MVLFPEINKIRQLSFLLGSGSPRRKQLFSELSLKFRVRVIETDEKVDPKLSGFLIAEDIALKKSLPLMNERQHEEILITADTIVCLDEKVLGKPIDEADAFRMLKELNGKCHSVYTGVFISNGKRDLIFHDTTLVYFNNLTDEQILNYINLYKPFDKAGSYGAQEGLPVNLNLCSDEEYDFLKSINEEVLFQRTLSVNHSNHIPLIDHIEGSYFNVMGLPVVSLLKIIAKEFL